eukprot:TRINITY_DN6009_c0_g1_i1.p1 TRINITY_DN6009_c0_g1~~TRINITY_DN6009_c0_g1_i1.p1  ORF type:complete len:2562 (+),score=562.49 TRINITY_DN6009_c0_g1_i1:137-7687(+)
MITSKAVLEEIFKLLHLLMTFSCEVSEMKLMMGLLLDAQGEKPPYWPFLLSTLRAVQPRGGPDHFFNLDGLTSGIQILLPQKIPTNGYSFAAWVRFESLADRLAQDQSYTPYILSFMSQDGCYGLELFLHNHVLCARTSNGRTKSDICNFSKFSPQSKKWYHIAFVHEYKLLKTSQMNLYIDGALIASQGLIYPKSEQSLTSCYIGTNALPIISGITTNMVNSPKPQPLFGQIGLCYFASESLSSSEVSSLYNLGPKKISSNDTGYDELSNQLLLPERSKPVRILFGLHPKAHYGPICYVLSSSQNNSICPPYQIQNTAASILNTDQMQEVQEAQQLQHQYQIKILQKQAQPPQQPQPYSNRSRSSQIGNKEYEDVNEREITFSESFLFGDGKKDSFSSKSPALSKSSNELSENVRSVQTPFQTVQENTIQSDSCSVYINSQWCAIGIMLNGTTVSNSISIHEAFIQAGGLKLLLPLFQQLETPILPENETQIAEDRKKSNETVSQVSESSSMATRGLIGLLDLISTMAETNPRHLQEMQECHFISLLSHAMLRLPPTIWSPSVISSLDKLGGILRLNKTLYGEFLQEIMCNFDVWVYSSFMTQMSVSTTLQKYVSDGPDGNAICKQFVGVPRVINIIRMYYWTFPEPDIALATTPMTKKGKIIGFRLSNPEEIRSIRWLLMKLISLLMMKPTQEEVKCFVEYLESCSDDSQCLDLCVLALKNLIPDPSIAEVFEKVCGHHPWSGVLKRMPKATSIEEKPIKVNRSEIDVPLKEPNPIEDAKSQVVLPSVRQIPFSPQKAKRRSLSERYSIMVSKNIDQNEVQLKWDSFVGKLSPVQENELDSEKVVEQETTSPELEKEKNSKQRNEEMTAEFKQSEMLINEMHTIALKLMCYECWMIHSNQITIAGGASEKQESLELILSALKIAVRRINVSYKHYATLIELLVGKLLPRVDLPSPCSSGTEELIRCPRALIPLFEFLSVIANSPSHSDLFRTAISEIKTLLINHSSNREMFLTIPQWQTMLFSLLPHPNSLQATQLSIENKSDDYETITSIIVLLTHHAMRMINGWLASVEMHNLALQHLRLQQFTNDLSLSLLSNLVYSISNDQTLMNTDLADKPHVQENLAKLIEFATITVVRMQIDSTSQILNPDHLLCRLRRNADGSWTDFEFGCKLVEFMELFLSTAKSLGKSRSLTSPSPPSQSSPLRLTHKPQSTNIFSTLSSAVSSAFQSSNPVSDYSHLQSLRSVDEWFSQASKNNDSIGSKTLEGYYSSVLSLDLLLNLIILHEVTFFSDNAEKISKRNTSVEKLKKYISTHNMALGDRGIQSLSRYVSARTSDINNQHRYAEKSTQKSANYTMRIISEQLLSPSKEETIGLISFSVLFLLVSISRIEKSSSKVLPELEALISSVVSSSFGILSSLLPPPLSTIEKRDFSVLVSKLIEMFKLENDSLTFFNEPISLYRQWMMNSLSNLFSSMEMCVKNVSEMSEAISERETEFLTTNEENYIDYKKITRGESHMFILSFIRQMEQNKRKHGREWKRFIRGEVTQAADHWKLDRVENSLRQRVRLTPAHHFDTHAGLVPVTSHHEALDNFPPLQVMNAMNSSVEIEEENEEDELCTPSDLKEDSKNPSLSGGIDEIDEGGEEKKERRMRKRKHEIESTPVVAAGGIICSYICDAIFPMRAVPGMIHLFSDRIVLLPNPDEKAKCATLKFEHSKVVEADKRHAITCMLEKLTSVLERRFAHSDSALEFFFKDITLFINFRSRMERDNFYHRFISYAPSVSNLKYWTRTSLLSTETLPPRETFKKTYLLDLWMNWKISNFEYLMALNTIAGRTYCDLSQYPVFPWVISDYESKVLDFNDPKTFRDLSKPIGALFPKRLEQAIRKFEMSSEDKESGVPPYHYGTHYSSLGIVLHYLVRVENFTTYFLEFQGNKFDISHRMFCSIPKMWKSAETDPGFCKELIPEFFYLPEMFVNKNRFNMGFGRLTGGLGVPAPTDEDGLVSSGVGDVELPPWASTPEEFVRLNREALESEYVSSHLHEWIDLIFGFKQRGREAELASNVFYYLTYSSLVNIDKVNDPVQRSSMISQILNFGQTPQMLFKKAHPQRLKKPQNVPYLPRMCSESLDSLKQYSPSPIVRIFPMVDNKVGLLFKDHGYSICYLNSLTKMQGDRESLDSDGLSEATQSAIKSKQTLVNVFLSDGVDVSKCCASSSDGNFLLTCGNWNGKSFLRFPISSSFNPNNMKLFSSQLSNDSSVSTCSGWCNDAAVLGYSDGTLHIYCLSDNDRYNLQHQKPSEFSKATHIVHAHPASVFCMAIGDKVDTIASCSVLSNVILLHSIRKGSFIRSISLGNDDSIVSLDMDSESGTIISLSLSGALHLFSLNGTLLARKLLPLSSSIRLPGIPEDHRDLLWTTVLPTGRSQCVGYNTASRPNKEGVLCFSRSFCSSNVASNSSQLSAGIASARVACGTRDGDVFILDSTSLAVLREIKCECGVSAISFIGEKSEVILVSLVNGSLVWYLW